MEEFAKVVEVYKWRGGASKQKETVAAPPSPVTCGYGEEESAGSGCVGSPPKRDDAHSSPSPSLLQNMGHDVHMHTTKTDVYCAGMPNRALSFVPGWHRPRQRHPSKKKPRLLHSHSTRQLVFSVEELGAKGSAEGRIRPKKMIKKDQRKRKKAEIKQDRTKSMPHVEACNSPDFYDDSECENGSPFMKDFYSPDRSYSPGQPSPSEVATCREGKGGAERTSNDGAQHAFEYCKSPYFMHPKRKAKSKVANQEKDRLNNKSENKSAKVKPSTKRQKKKGNVLQKLIADTIETKQSAGHTNDSLDREDFCEQSARLPKQLVNPSDSGVLPGKATSKAKKSAYFEAIVKALGQRDIANKTWVPPISVHALIQEELYKDPWKVLVACMLLNKTNGKQMRKIIWDLFDLCPTPEAAVSVETSKIEDVIRHLGLQKKRARMIQKFSRDYLGKDWIHVGQLHGIGKYATDAYAIFCEGRWQEVKPEDHKLVDYWKYLCDTDGLGYAFKDDREKGDEVLLQASSAETCPNLSPS